MLATKLFYRNSSLLVSYPGCLVFYYGTPIYQLIYIHISLEYEGSMLHIQGTVTCTERGISQTVESKMCDTYGKLI